MMILTVLCKLILTLSLFFSNCMCTVAFDYETTREEILASRRNRKDQMQLLVDDAQEQLKDHENGTFILNDKDLKSITNKIALYNRKLETMQGEMDEQEVEKIMIREKAREERYRERQEERDEL